MNVKTIFLIVSKIMNLYRFIMGSMMNWLTRWLEAFGNYLFPEEHIINIHHSVINQKVLHGFRIFALTYLSVIYFWALSLFKSALGNIIYLTMIGYFLAWLYFLLVLQDYHINGFGRWGRVLPLCSK